MRVLTVMPGLTPDAGAEQSLAAVAPMLGGEGIQLHLAVLTERQDLVPTLERPGVVIHDLSGAKGLWGRVRALRAVISAVDPAVVHATLHEAVLPTQLAVGLGGRPVVFTWANTLYDAENRGELGRSAWKLRIIQAVDTALGRATGARYHAVTPGVATVNRRTMGVPADRVFVAERGRSTPSTVDPAAVEQVRLELDLDRDAVVLLACGRHEPQKDHVGMLTMFDQLSARRPEAVLLLAGRAGRASVAIDARLATMRHASNVRVLGHRDDVSHLLAAADVMVCTSRREGAAGALLEAMASAVPIVSVPLAGLEGILVDDETSVVVPLDEMAGAIDRLLDDPDRRARLGQAGAAMFAERFTLERSAAALADMYRWTAESAKQIGPAVAHRRQRVPLREGFRE